MNSKFLSFKVLIFSHRNRVHGDDRGATFSKMASTPYTGGTFEILSKPPKKPLKEKNLGEVKKSKPDKNKSGKEEDIKFPGPKPEEMSDGINQSCKTEGGARKKYKNGYSGISI